MTGFDIGLDLFPLLAATLAAVGCGLLGNFLVLRRLSLMGDAISHSVLPGLVIAFLVTTSRSPFAMFVGAGAAGVATVVLVELVKKLGRVEPGAAMGVVFSVLFAFGVLLIERAAVRHVDLDADCVLHGQLETLAWYGAPDSWAGLLRWSTLEHVPRQVTTLAIMVGLTIAFMTLFFKELRIAAFDPALATTQGFGAGLMHYLLMIFVAGATVASFEAVGSILVIAMLICPAATARLLTDRLLPQVLWSGGIALTCGVGGYAAATFAPALIGKDAVNAAGAMAMMGGAALTLAIVAAPRHGVVAKHLRQRRLARRVAAEDLLVNLYRRLEAGEERVGLDAARRLLGGRPLRPAIAAAVRARQVERDEADLRLTSRGREDAAQILRRHRLWEQYLVSEAGLQPDHVHPTAARLEHLPSHPPGEAELDPHGRPIPPGRG